MVEDAKVIYVMIASPGDVAAERKKVEEAIEQWNTNHFESTNVLLRPLRWEMDAHRDAADETQSIIDDDLITRSDFVVGIFWQTLGRKAGDAISYTVGELKKHVDAGKSVSLFFKEPGSPQTVAENRKIAKVLAFKSKISSELGKGCIYSNFKNSEDFKIYERLEKDVEAFLKKKGISKGANDKKAKTDQLSYMATLFSVKKIDHTFEYVDESTIRYTRNVDVIAKVSGVRYFVNSYTWNAGGKIEYEVDNKKQKIVDSYTHDGKNYYTVRLERDTIAGKKYNIKTERIITDAKFLQEQHMTATMSSSDTVDEISLALKVSNDFSISDILYEVHENNNICSEEDDLKLDENGYIIKKVTTAKKGFQYTLSWKIAKKEPNGMDETTF